MSQVIARAIYDNFAEESDELEFSKGKKRIFVTFLLTKSI